MPAVREGDLQSHRDSSKHLRPIHPLLGQDNRANSVVEIKVVVADEGRTRSADSDSEVSGPVAMMERELDGIVRKPGDFLTHHQQDQRVRMPRPR